MSHPSQTDTNKDIFIRIPIGFIFLPMTSEMMEEFMEDVGVYQKDIQNLVKRKTDYNKTVSGIALYETRKRQLMIEALQAADTIDRCLRCIKEIDEVPVFVNMSNTKYMLRDDICTTQEKCKETASEIRQKYAALLEKLAAAKLTSLLTFDVDRDAYVQPHENMQETIVEPLQKTTPSTSRSGENKATKKRTTSSAGVKKTQKKQKHTDHKESNFKAVMNIVSNLGK